MPYIFSSKNRADARNTFLINLSSTKKSPCFSERKATRKRKHWERQMKKLFNLCLLGGQSTWMRSLSASFTMKSPRGKVRGRDLIAQGFFFQKSVRLYWIYVIKVQVLTYVSWKFVAETLPLNADSTRFFFTKMYWICVIKVQVLICVMMARGRDPL